MMNKNKVIIIFLSISVCLFKNYSMAQPSNEQINAFRSAKNAHILVDQSYGTAKKVELPFYDIAEGLLKYAELPITESDIGKYTLIIQIIAKGEPKASSYRDRETGSIDERYAQATMEGKILLKIDNIPAYKEEFEGSTGTILNIGSESYISPSDAPFNRLLESTSVRRNPGSSFPQKIFLLIARIFGAQPLIGALHDDDNYFRENAAIALGSLKQTVAVDALIAALNDKDFHVREYAAESLGHIGDKRAVKPLIEILDDRWGGTRRNAIEALGKIGDARAVEPLIAALKDQVYTVRESSAEALGQIGDTRAVEPLIAALKDENSFVREHAVEALGQIGDARAVEPLIAALKDEHSRVRMKAPEALGKITKQDFDEDQEKWQQWWDENKEEILENK